MSEVKLFVAELDDDFQEIGNITEAELIRRAYCYFLLADGLLIHPAYLWQSQISNMVVRAKLFEIFRPPFASMVLGDSQSVPDYITDRMNSLNKYRKRQTTQELGRYLFWQGDITTQAAQLDKTFDASYRLRLSESRDIRFRKLLSTDLEASLDPSSLIALVRQAILQDRLGGDAGEVAASLRSWIAESSLVSVETFTTRVRDGHGLRLLVERTAFKKRMLHIYYHANVENDMVVPGASNLHGVVDPYDSAVFWEVFETLFGKDRSRVLSENKDAHTILAIREIRDHQLWHSYRGIYFEVLRTIEGSLVSHVNAIKKDIEDHSGQSDVFILRRMWRRGKLLLVNTFFGLFGAFSGGPAEAVTGIPALIFGSLGSGGLIDSIKRFVHEYHSNDLTRLQYMIHEKTAQILLAKK